MEPEFLNGAYRRKEPLEISGLGNIAIRPEFVTSHNVLLRRRTANTPDLNMAQLRYGFHFRQHFVAVVVRQIEIENHQIGANGVGIPASAPQKVNSLIGTHYKMNTALVRSLRQRFSYQHHIPRIVIPQYDFWRR